ncbi:MAG: S41 family peptidase [Anaerolineae bacterium]|nr:S41 family peptidase [Anaerolineae bacterium]MCO5195742.1 S41 family peptidase [Anaerolineae bacterium]
MKKWIARIALLFGIGLVVLVAANWSLVNQIASFSPIFMPRSGPKPENEAEARLQDIEYLAKVLDYDRSFDEAARIEFEKLIASSKQNAGTMSLVDLYLLGAKATALADNGHTGMSGWPVRTQFNSVGVRYFQFQDGLFVVRALAEHEQLLGGRVIEIDGQPIDAVLTALHTYTGGTEAWRQLHAVKLLESAEIMHAAGLAASPSGYTLTVADQAGTRIEVPLTAQLPPADSPAPETKAWNTLDAATWPAEGDAWVHGLQSVTEEEVPLYLQNIGQRYMWTPVQDGGGYVRLQSIQNTEAQSIPAFFEETIKPLPDGSLRYLVVDLRANGGGDFTLFVETAKWLPDKVVDGGHLYVVVGPQTFSAAISSTALLKYYGGEKTIIIGTPMGDRAQYWSEWGVDFRLPNSDFQVVYTTGYHDWANGCSEHPYCFTPVVKHGVAAGSLAPNHIIEPTYADYAAGRDVVMEWVFQQELP